MLAIIHKKISPRLAIDQLLKQEFIKIFLYPGYLLEQCVKTWRFFRNFPIFGDDFWGKKKRKGGGEGGFNVKWRKFATKQTLADRHI